MSQTSGVASVIWISVQPQQACSDRSFSVRETSINSLHPWAAFQEGPSAGSEQGAIIPFPKLRMDGGGGAATRCLSHRPSCHRSQFVENWKKRLP